MDHPILAQAQSLLKSKGEDYNGGEVSYSNRKYFPYGDKSYITMLHIKLERIKSLAVVHEGMAANFEGLNDSVLDLINYSAMYGAYLLEEKTKDATITRK